MQFAITFWKDGGTPDCHEFLSVAYATSWALQQQHQGRGISLTYDDGEDTHDLFYPPGSGEWQHLCCRS